MAASDIFIGKSGASTVAEATYFGCGMIISNYATSIEQRNGEYYENQVGNALKIFEVHNIIEKLRAWSKDDAELKTLQRNAEQNRDEYGSEKTADLLFSLLQEKFPHLKELEQAI